MKVRHLEGVAALERVVSRRPWSKSLFRSELTQMSSAALVAVDETAVVVGFGCSIFTGSETHITNLAVDESARRQRIGARLLVALLVDGIRRGSESATLEVRPSNTAAISLYQRAGFAPVGARPRYYQDDGEDALIMWCHELASAAVLEKWQALIAPYRVPPADAL
jgi:ribosomal-protein-alanine N-acetyltransferase